MSRRQLALDGAAILVVGVIAFAAARSAYLSGPRMPFYQRIFGPAVMVATGHGFGNPEATPDSPLEAFLTERVDVLEAGSVGEPRRLPLDHLQVAHRYLLTMVGLWWRMTGISWQRLAEIVALLHAFAAVAVYALIRLFTPSVPAAFGALWYAVSPVTVGYAPMVRDFAKAPFVLGAIPLVLAAVLRLSSTRALISGALSLGAIVGIGIGFRMDVALMAPIAIASILLFRGRYPWTAWAQKAAAVAALVASLTVTAWPVVSRMSAGGSNAFHVILLGSSEWFDKRLGVEPAPYSLVPFYSDLYLMNVLRQRAVASRGADAPFPSAAYDEIGRELWLRWVRHFPADVHTRLLAAMNGVMNLAFDNVPGTPGPYWPAEQVRGFFSWLDGFDGHGWMLAAAIVLVAARLALPLAVFAAGFLLALTGYPSLQFDGRHYFHLQALPIATLVVFGWTTLTWIADAVRSRTVDPARWSWSTWKYPLALTAAVAVMLTVLPAATLRAYQERHLESEIAALVNAERVPVAVDVAALDTHRFLARWEGASGEPTGLPQLRFAYFVAEFAADQPRSIMSIGLRYSAEPDWTPCSLERTLATADGIVRFAFPVYTVDGVNRFEGIELGEGMKSRLRGVYRVTPPNLDLAVEMRLASDWPARRLSQRIVGEERFATDDVGAWVSLVGGCGAAIVPVDSTLGAALLPSPERVDQIFAPQLRVDGSGIVFDGAVEAASPLVRFVRQPMRAGDVLVARVWLDQGSVTIGVLKNGSYHRQELVTRPGASVIIIRVDEDGEYAPLISAPDPGWRSSVKFSIDRFGIVPGSGNTTPPSRP